MTLPPAADVSMLTLGALLAGWDFREQFGEMWVEVPGGGPQPVPGRVLDMKPEAQVALLLRYVDLIYLLLPR